MAGEIVETSRERLRKGRTAFNLLYVYPVDPLVAIGGVVQKLCQKENLPPGVETFQLISPAELAGIVSGSVFFMADQIVKEEVETLADVLLKARIKYRKGIRLIARARLVYAEAGNRYDAEAAAGSGSLPQ